MGRAEAKSQKMKPQRDPLGIDGGVRMLGCWGTWKIMENIAAVTYIYIYIHIHIHMIHMHLK